MKPTNVMFSNGVNPPHLLTLFYDGEHYVIRESGSADEFFNVNRRAEAVEIFKELMTRAFFKVLE